MLKNECNGASYLFDIPFKKGVFGFNIPYFMKAYGKEFEDTKEVIGMSKSKQDRQHNGQKKKDKQ